MNRSDVLHPLVNLTNMRPQHSPQSLVFLLCTILTTSAAVPAFAQSPSPQAGSTAQKSNTAENPLRTWSTSDGRFIQASLVNTDGALVMLRMANGQTGTIPIQKLSPADQTFIRTKLGANAQIVLPKAPVEKNQPLLPAAKRIWPEKVTPDEKALDVTQVSEASSDQQYVYHSRNFEFVSQDKLAGSVMKEIARTFEATRTLADTLPWGIQPKPPADLGYYRAKFYVDRKHYTDDGAPANSGGVYMRRDRIFKIPFESLGLEMRGKTWFKNENYRNDTIVHEVTHQMMHDFLTFLPIWMTEGSADYTAMLPYRAGTFSSAMHEKGIKEYIKSYQLRSVGSLADVGSLTELMKMTSEEWHSRADKGAKEQSRLYFSSCLLVYFFCHLDGDGHGTPLLLYFDKIREARDAWAEFLANPAVKRNPDGSSSYPSNLSAPAQPRSPNYGIELGKMLASGRDEAQLKRAFTEGFKKIGVR